MEKWTEAARGFGGRISDFPLTSVLQILELGKKSGFLHVRQFPRMAFLVLKEGGVIQAVSSMRRMGLGELLMAEGLISEKDVQRGLSVQRETSPPKVLGAIFRDMGLVSQEQILFVLKKQVKEIFQWILRWEEGEFTFYASKQSHFPHVSDDEELLLPVGVVVQEILKETLSDHERRKFPRAPVSLKVVRADTDPPRTYYTHDVSGGGLFILSEEFPSEGDRLELDIWIPTLMEPARAACQVVRVEDRREAERAGFAVEFRRIDEEARTILESLGSAVAGIMSPGASAET